jgi:hypothetical protein
MEEQIKEWYEGGKETISKERTISRRIPDCL